MGKIDELIQLINSAPGFDDEEVDEDEDCARILGLLKNLSEELILLSSNEALAYVAKLEAQPFIISALCELAILAKHRGDMVNVLAYVEAWEAYEAQTDDSCGVAAAFLAAAMGTREAYLAALERSRGEAIPRRCLALFNLFMGAPPRPDIPEINEELRKCLELYKGLDLAQRVETIERLREQAVVGEVTDNPLAQMLISGFLRVGPIPNAHVS